MTLGASWKDYWERVGLGLCGATAVVLPSFLSWYDSAFNQTPPSVSAVRYTTGVVLAIGWVVAIWIVSKEQDHAWNCVFKAAGIPGIFVGLAKITQIPV